MRNLLFISILALLHVSCTELTTSKKRYNTEKEIEESLEKKEKVSLDSNRKENYDLGNNIQVVKSTNSETNKLKQERIDQIESMKRIILRNQSTPSIKIDSFAERHEELKKFYFGKSCNQKDYELVNNYNIEFNDIYPNSSKNTGIYDGKIFCLRKLDKPNVENSIVVYGRSEGGHSSDQVTLITINNETKRIYHLPLSYYTGWDGHETVVKSTMINNKITREIEERFGWSSLHPDSLIKQPRRIVTQKIIVKENGNMQMMSEDIAKFNINELFE